MKRLVILFCLVLAGCATIKDEGKVAPGLLKTQKPACQEKASVKPKSIDIEEGYLDSIIFAFSDAIKKNPNFGGFYYNRGIAYFYKKDCDRCWSDVSKAQALGFKFEKGFIKELRRACGDKK